MTDPVFDLNAYFARIGYTGATEPSLPLLRELVALHPAAIAFENLDVSAGRPIALDADALQHKMVRQQRGGYCFEQNTLFLAALRALGFRATGLIAHVRLGIPATVEMPRTHMVLRVDLPEGAFLADVGFGGLTPTAPLELSAGTEQPTPHEVFRLMEAAGELALEARVADQWSEIYRFGPQEQRPIDYEVANWFTATHPNGPFVKNVIAARPVPGERRTLFNWRFTRRRNGLPIERQVVRSAANHHRILREEFGLTLSDDQLAATLAVLRRHDPDETPFGPFA